MKSLPPTFFKVLLCSAFLLSFSACKSNDSTTPDTIAKDEIKKIELTGKLKAAQKAAQAEVIEAISPLKERQRLGFRLPTRSEISKSSSHMQKALERLGDKMRAQSDKPEEFDKKIPVNIQDPEGDLASIIDNFSHSELLNFQYILDPAVKGKIRTNIKTENTLSRHDAWNLFEQILYIGDAYASIDAKGVLRILPLAKLKNDNRIDLEGKDGRIAIEHLYMQNSDATAAVAAIKPYLSKGASATVLTRSNSVIIVETGSNMDKLRALLTVLDEKGQSGWPQMAYSCKNIDAKVIAAELEEAMPVLGLTLTFGDKGHGVKMASIDRMNILILSSATQEVLDELMRWVQILDSSETSEAVKIYSYPVKHGESSDLVDAISIFFPKATAAAARQRTNAPAGEGTSQRAANPVNRALTQPRKTQTKNRNRTQERQASVFEEPVTIFEDKRRNQLMIRTTPRTFNMLKAILNHLDAPPMQVMVQVTAVEIDLNQSLEYGFEYSAEKLFGSKNVTPEDPTGILGRRTGSIGVGSSIVGSSTFTPAGGVSPGISMLLQRAGVDNEFAFVKAVAGNTNSRLLFCPQIQTLNNEEAEINIGQSVPVRRGSNSNQNGVQDNIEYRDTGVILRVTPQISADKSVTLNVEVEISSISKDSVSGIDSPVINENKVKTKLLVRNDDTILLGGIISKNDQVTKSGIPYLRDIPYLGFFFGGSATSNGKKELVLFVKVSVVENQSDYEKMIKRYNKSIEYRKESPELD